MSRFSELKKVKGRQIIVDFPYGDVEIKVCLKVLNVIDDLTAAMKAREYAKSKGVEEIDEKQPEYCIRLQSEIVYRCTYECINAGTEENPDWKATNNRFFTDAEEIVTGLDQDSLLFLYEYYQNFRSISNKNEEFTPENIARISHELGGEGDEEKRANFFYQLPRHFVYRYIRFMAKLLVNAVTTNSSLFLNSTIEHTVDSRV